MSVGFYATLAGDRLDQSKRNYRAAHSWHMRAEELEQQLRDTEWRYERLELINEQTQQANQKLVQENESWKRHANELRQKVVAWQRSAIQGEAISRAKTVVVEEHTGGKAPIDMVGEERFSEIIEGEKLKVMEEWGINPWESNGT
jgi:TolA-binding protein